MKVLMKQNHLIKMKIPYLKKFKKNQISFGLPMKFLILLKLIKSPSQNHNPGYIDCESSPPENRTQTSTTTALHARRSKQRRSVLPVEESAAVDGDDSWLAVSELDAVLSVAIVVVVVVVVVVVELSDEAEMYNRQTTFNDLTAA